MLGISKKIYNFVLTIKNKLMRKKIEKKPKKDPAYMLFLFGDFTDTDELINGLSTQFIPMVTSTFLKYTYGEYGVVFHFRSNETFGNVKEYVDMILNDITDQYFLMEATKNVDIRMDRKLKKDFLNIDGDLKKEENKNGAVDVELEKKDMKNFNIDLFFPIFDPNSIFNKEKEEIEPTTDEILDKISQNGIESLTEKEKQILDNYGKRKNGGR
jgi:hypothetical protein